MSNGSGVSRGDRNRNARLARLRVLVPSTNAIVGIDLADKKQMVVVTDHDSKVLARKTFRCRAWDLGAALDWASKQATAKGFAGVTVACEPTGHRLQRLRPARSHRFGGKSPGQQQAGVHRPCRGPQHRSGHHPGSDVDHAIVEVVLN